MFLINEDIMYNKRMKSGKAWEKDVNTLYSNSSAEKSAELLGEVYNIYRHPIETDSEDDNGCELNDNLSNYTVCIDAFGVDVEIGFIRLDGTFVLFTPIGKVCNLINDEYVGKFATLNKNGTPNLAAINKLCNAKNAFAHGALNVISTEKDEMAEKLNSIHKMSS
jgi:hypothetical protein